MNRHFASVGILVFLITALWSTRLSAWSSVDFKAFYCGGAASALGADPYRVEPLRTCEHNDENIHAASLTSGSVVPVPLPGYDLAAFALISRLPYANAALLWQCILWSFTALTIVTLTRLTTLPLFVVCAALLFSEGYIASFVGQPTPIAVGGIALAAWSTSKRRPVFIGLGAALAMCEPHIGLGTVAALLFLLPTARLSVLISMSILAALTYAATGLQQTIEYVRDVLPLHAHAEINHEGQYSLTYLLHLIGFSENTAVIAGTLSYGILLVLGILIAQRLRTHLRDDALIAVIPPVFTLIGGPFMHLVQISAVLPAALLLYAKTPELRLPLGWAIMLLATPWAFFVELQGLFPIFALCTEYLGYYFTGSLRITTLTTLTQCAILTGAATAFRFEKINARIIVPPTALSEEAWRPIVDLFFTQHLAFFLPLKIPTWLGELLVAWAAIKRGWKQS